MAAATGKPRHMMVGGRPQRAVCLHCRGHVMEGRKFCMVRLKDVGGQATDLYVHEACLAAYQSGLRRRQTTLDEAGAHKGALVRTTTTHDRRRA